MKEELSYTLAKKVDNTGELAYQGLIEIAKDYIEGDLYHCDNIIYEVVEIFLDTTNEYTIEYFQKFCNQIRVWNYREFKTQFKTLSDFCTYDNLIFEIDCQWASSDYGDDYIICYKYHNISKEDTSSINIIGTYMECERLITLYEHEILSWTDIESSIYVFNEYLNNYLGDWNTDNYNDEYEYCWAILNRIDQLIGGIL